jgi:hypothetical protein
MAEWLVVSSQPIELKEVCSMCLNDNLLKKSCVLCGKTGEVTAVYYSLIRSNDIVMVSTGSGEPGHEVFRSVMSKQTPRVPTIELAHIFRAYINGYVEEQERIEEYGKSNAEFLKSLIVPFVPDPWEGRCLFSFGPDERSQTKDQR